MPLVQSSISAIVGSFVTAMYLRGNTDRVEFQKIKAGKINEAVDDLVASRDLTLTELIKCKNLIDIAKIADDEYAKQCGDEKHSQNDYFDFDWFLRFFEAAGNVSDADMKLLWAKILAGEVKNRGRYSLRTISTLHNLSSKEAEVFKEIAAITLISDGHPFVLDSPELMVKYLGSMEKLMLLVECGLMMTGSVKQRKSIDGNSLSLTFDNSVFFCTVENNSPSLVYFDLQTLPFTRPGLDLFYLIFDTVKVNLQYLVDSALLLRENNPNLTIKVMAREMQMDGNPQWSEVLV